MNYKINILGAVLSFGYYHQFESDFKTHLHFLMTDIFHSAEKKKGLVYFKKSTSIHNHNFDVGLIISQIS